MLKRDMVCQRRAFLVKVFVYKKNLLCQVLKVTY